MALLRLSQRPRVSDERPDPRELIDRGRAYLLVKGLTPVPDELALETGYCLWSVGPSFDLVMRAYERLGSPIPETETTETGQRRFAWDGGAVRDESTSEESGETTTRALRRGDRGRGRTAIANIRLTPTDKAILERLATSKGVSLSTWVREKLLGVAELEQIERGEKLKALERRKLHQPTPIAENLATLGGWKQPAGPNTT